MSKKKEIENPSLEIKDDGSYTISLSPKHVANWAAENKIPQELANWFINDVEESVKKHNKYKGFLSKKPTEKEMLDFVKKMTDSKEKGIRKLKSTIQFQDFIINNWDILSATFDNEPTLFDCVKHDENFGVSRHFVDILYYLAKLLGSAKLTYTGNNSYQIKGEITNSIGEAICLVYEFEADSQEGAKKIANDFKKFPVRQPNL